MSAEPVSPALELEPKSPMWLPGLGAALFLAAGVWWMLTPPFGQDEAKPDPAAGKVGAAADGTPEKIARLVDAGIVPIRRVMPAGH